MASDDPDLVEEWLRGFTDGLMAAVRQCWPDADPELIAEIFTQRAGEWHGNA